MKIKVKLLATYREKLPPDAKGNTCTIEIPEGSGVAVVFERFDIDYDNSNVVLINGLTHEQPPPLNEGDVVCIFSAIAGG
jgi:molybdopterin converting factor small subunit